jgi:adenosylhomocysteine nucleosidase
MIGIICALKEESQLLQNEMKDKKEFQHGSFPMIQGRLSEKQVILGICGVGMIGAASLTTVLIEKYHVTLLILSGVGGALRSDLKIGDVVIGTGIINYDLDCTSYDKNLLRGQDPFTGARMFECAPFLTHKFMGNILCTQEFLSMKRKIEIVKDQKEEFLIVEMEGAGMAKVATEYNVPFIILRGVSDTFSHDEVQETTAEQFAKSLTLAIQSVSQMTQSILSLGSPYFRHST